MTDHLTLNLTSHFLFQPIYGGSNNLFESYSRFSTEETSVFFFFSLSLICLYFDINIWFYFFTLYKFNKQPVGTYLPSCDTAILLSKDCFLFMEKAYKSLGSPVTCRAKLVLWFTRHRPNQWFHCLILKKIFLF